VAGSLGVSENTASCASGYWITFRALRYGSCFHIPYSKHGVLVLGKKYPEIGIRFSYDKTPAII